MHRLWTDAAATDLYASHNWSSWKQLYVFRTLDKRNFGSWLLMPHAIFKLTNSHPICASWHVICVLLRTIEMIHVTFHELSMKHVQINVPGLQIKNLTNVILERIESSSQVTLAIAPHSHLLLSKKENRPLVTESLI